MPFEQVSLLRMHHLQVKMVELVIGMKMKMVTMVEMVMRVEKAGSHNHYVGMLPRFYQILSVE